MGYFSVRHYKDAMSTHSHVTISRLQLCCSNILKRTTFQITERQCQALDSTVFTCAMISKLEVWNIFTQSLSQGIERTLVNSFPMYAYWDKDRGPIKWPRQAVTIAQHGCA